MSRMAKGEVPGMGEGGDPFPMPIDGELDLHSFRPAEIPSLLDEYIAECVKKGIWDIRIVHGKGTGTLRELVHARLAKNPAVVRFSLAEPGNGGWGATVAHLADQNRS